MAKEAPVSPLPVLFVNAILVGMGLIIESPKIYKSLRNIFELAWSGLPESKQPFHIDS